MVNKMSKSPSSGGKWRQVLGVELKNEWQNNKYDSCNLRPEYFYVKALFKGASSNCFISRHIDPNKELYFPDDPTYTSSRILCSIDIFFVHSSRNFFFKG